MSSATHACANAKPYETCGTTTLISNGVTLTTEFVLDGPSDAPLTVWLPGGPNDYATVLLEANREVVTPLFPGTRVLAVDPPRSTNGEWALSACLPDSTQRDFYDSLLMPPSQTVQVAKSYALACRGKPGSTYNADVEAQVIASAIKAVDSVNSEVLVYAMSADAEVAMALAQHGVRVVAVVLDSPSPRTQSGLEVVENQVSSAIAGAHRAFDGTVGKPKWIASLESPDASAYVLAALRTPAMTTEDYQQALQRVEEGETRAVADQYFRRFGSEEFSGLNGSYYSGVCTDYTWPSEDAYLTAMAKAEANAGEYWPLARFLFAYHMPCLFWDLGSKGLEDQFQGNPASRTPGVVLSSSRDPVVGSAGEEWARNTGLTYIGVNTVGHQSLLSVSGCTFDEATGTDIKGERCSNGILSMESGG